MHTRIENAYQSNHAHAAEISQEGELVAV